MKTFTEQAQKLPVRCFDVVVAGGGTAGVVAAIERKLGCKLFISEHAQLCGALGAALFALEAAQATRP